MEVGEGGYCYLFFDSVVTLSLEELLSAAFSPTGIYFYFAFYWVGWCCDFCGYFFVGNVLWVIQYGQFCVYYFVCIFWGKFIVFLLVFSYIFSQMKSHQMLPREWREYSLNFWDRLGPFLKFYPKETLSSLLLLCTFFMAQSNRVPWFFMANTWGTLGFEIKRFTITKYQNQNKQKQLPFKKS